MPLACCEKCCEKRSYIFVNKLQRPIKYYTWKMMVCANLVLPIYNKMIKEEENNKKVEQTN